MIIFFGFFFLACLGLLLGGYYVYGAFIDRVFQPDQNRSTPATTMADGVDFVEMPPWKIFLIQLLLGRRTTLPDAARSAVLAGMLCRAGRACRRYVYREVVSWSCAAATPIPLSF